MIFKNTGSAMTSPSRPWPAERIKHWPIERLMRYANNRRVHSEADPRQSRRVDALMGVAKIDRRQLHQLTGGPHVLMPRGTGISNPPPSSGESTNFRFRLRL